MLILFSNIESGPNQTSDVRVLWNLEKDLINTSSTSVLEKENYNNADWEYKYSAKIEQ